jgi:imidazoleglycerol-phosphate dehydratase/histidinol-phosphatase
LSIILPLLQGEGVVFADTLSDAIFADDISRFCAVKGYEIRSSWYVSGVPHGDVEALAEGLRAIQIDATQEGSWGRTAQLIVAASRSSRVKRVTAETAIELDISLEGGSGVTVETGLGFFDHMLTLLFVHAGFSVTLRAVGDLHVDEHHLVEDVGLVLGQAIREALGDKRGISRYGFLLPMDEALAEVAIDLAGRYEFVWNVTWARERLGDMPTELFKHFFKSLAETLRCCLHMSVRGEDQHHKAEALFKGMGRVLRTACARESGSNEIPSSKGVL